MSKSRERGFDLGTLALFAARYAHNRDTGAAFSAVSAIKSIWPRLDEGTREQIISESYEAAYCREDWAEMRKWAKEQDDD